MRWCLHLWKSLFHCGSDQLLAWFAQRGCTVSILGDIQRLSGCGPGELAVGGPVWAGNLDQMTSRGHFQPQPWYNSVTDSVKKQKGHRNNGTYFIKRLGSQKLFKRWFDWLILSSLGERKYIFELNWYKNQLPTTGIRQILCVRENSYQILK